MLTTKVRRPETAGASSTAWDRSVPPIWREALWPLEWLGLRFSPVYYGLGVPRGDGGPVVLVPGFLGTDVYLTEMFMWLERIGYRPYMSRIGVNAECPGTLAGRLLRTVRHAHSETGKPVRIIGHSLGGVMGRRVCLEHPELVKQLITLGAPLQAMRAHPAIVASATLLHTALKLTTQTLGDCLTESCACGFVHDIGKPIDPSVDHAAIYTKADGVVDWHAAREYDAARNHEVGGTHIGLAFNPRAYRVLGELLGRRA
jgi:triacylglycerol lipase